MNSGTGRVRVLHLRLRHVHVDRRVPVFRGGHEGIPEGAAERALRRAGVLAFVISNTLSAMPFLILITFLSGTLCYFMVRLHPGFMHYVFFLLCLYASVTVVESLMMAIASIIPNFLMGIIIGAGIQRGYSCWYRGTSGSRTTSRSPSGGTPCPT
uniref:ABC-2 type transporter transmembrane domain-containing protein n=1 Tax=Aegilops tauschii subsp. strangulata TaxID=200361 RepID=A0A452YEL1_AEGTS